MPEKYIIPLIMLLFRATVLWVITTLSGAEKDNSLLKSFSKAIIISAIITVLFYSSDLVNLTGPYFSKISGFFNSIYFKAILSYLIIKLLYKFDWIIGFVIWLIWYFAQIPLNIFHDKLIKLILNYF